MHCTLKGSRLGEIVREGCFLCDKYCSFSMSEGDALHPQGSKQDRDYGSSKLESEMHPHGDKIGSDS